MNFESPLFIVPLITGPLLVISGYILLRRPPKKMNHLYGFRTHLAMKSKAHWDFAQTYSAKRMILWGAYYTLTLVLGFISSLNEMLEIFMAFILMVLFVLIPVIETQKKLKTKFEIKQKHL